MAGGHRDIGWPVAAGLRDRGLDVVIGARDAGADRGAAENLGVRAVTIDLLRPEGFEAALAEAGDFDVLVNNAGVMHDASPIASDSRMPEAMRVMLLRPRDPIRRGAPGMGARGDGRIVNLPSGWGSFAEGLGGPGAYGRGQGLAQRARSRAPARPARGRAGPRRLPRPGAHADGWALRHPLARGGGRHRDLARQPARARPRGRLLPPPRARRVVRRGAA